MGLVELEKTINKEFGDNIMYNAKDRTLLDIPRFSSGSLSLDIDLGGGWPEGKVIEIYGPESTGKSYLFYKGVATITNRKHNNKAVIIDEEGSWDNVWALACGVNLNNVKVVRSQYAEQALDIMEMCVESGEFGLVGLDSVAALIPKAELEASTEDWQMALVARLMDKACRKAYRALNASDRGGNPTTVFFINQLRIKLGVKFGNPETTKGGNALKYAAAIRLDVRRENEFEEDENENVTAVTMKYKTIKNKTAPPLRKGTLKYYVADTKLHGKADIDNSLALFDLGIETHNIIQAGSWYSGKWLGKKKFQGEKRCASYLFKTDTARKNAMIESLEENMLGGKRISFRFKDKETSSELRKTKKPKVKTIKKSKGKKRKPRK